MPVPTTIADLSTTAASNFPAGSDSPSSLDDVQRAHAAFIAQLRDLKATAGPLGASGITGAAASGANTDITSITGNAATVTNGVYTSGNQTIGGVKTFSSAISASITGSSASATTDSQHFCVGQTLTALTGSKAFGTTYTNSTGKPIFVIVNSTSAQGINYNITASINAVAFAVAGGYSASGAQFHNLSFPVPNGATYSVSLSGSGSLSSWSEIR